MRYRLLALLPLLLMALYGALPWGPPAQGAARGPAVDGPASTRYPMSYDAGRGVAVLYGGPVTWEYDGAWHAVTTTQTPALDMGGAMAYDAAHQVTVLGSMRDNYYGETWTYDGVDWTAGPPFPPSVYGAMVYDGARGRAVYFGGEWCNIAGCAYYDDTWEYTGTGWVAISTTLAPSARADHALAYDSAREVTVLFGGGTRAAGCFADTWEYDGANWQPVTPTLSPPARCAHALAYDAARGRTVLYGGPAGDTWEYDGVTWYPVTPTLSPPPRAYPAMVYDAARGVVVLHGGDRPGGGMLHDTWEYDGTTWRPVAPYTFYLPYIPRP